MLIRRNFLLILSLCLLLPNFFSIHFFSLSKEKHKWEIFEPSLVERLRSVDALLAAADSMAIAQEVKFNTLDYGIILNRLIKKRFYHGYSHFSLKENWMASVAGKLVWNDLSAIVLPDDILKYPMAACSQQSIVLMECFRRKGIFFRKVTFDHHFAVEGYFEGWYYFDPDLEPEFSDLEKRPSLKTLINENKLSKVYKNAMSHSEAEVSLANPNYGEVNVSPAANATIFQNLTKVLSRTIWLVPFAIFVFLLFRKNTSYLQNGERSTVTVIAKKKEVKE